MSALRRAATLLHKTCREHSKSAEDKRGPPRCRINRTDKLPRRRVGHRDGAKYACATVRPYWPRRSAPRAPPRSRRRRTIQNLCAGVPPDRPRCSPLEGRVLWAEELRRLTFVPHARVWPRNWGLGAALSAARHALGLLARRRRMR